MSANLSPIFKPYSSRVKGAIERGRLLELYLYPGNKCNRDCSFCTVYGSPRGWNADYKPKHLDAALEIVCCDERGTLIFYGGEPTLNYKNVIWAILYLREQGFIGAIVINSNGIQVERLLQILESDPLSTTTALLNYSIVTGDGAPPIPERSLQLLEAYEMANPGKIKIEPPDIMDAGKGMHFFTGDCSRLTSNSKCPRFYPVLTTEGKFQACPLAVENKSTHFQLGNLKTEPEEIVRNFKAFLTWLDTVHEPFAIQQNISACTVCQKHLQKLSVPAFEAPQKLMV